MLRDKYLLPMLTMLSLSNTWQAYAPVVHHHAMNVIQGRSSLSTYHRQRFTVFLASPFYVLRRSATNYDGYALQVGTRKMQQSRNQEGKVLRSLMVHPYLHYEVSGWQWRNSDNVF